MHGESRAKYVGLLVLGGVLSAGPSAQAHISVASGVGFADGTSEVTFGVGHGCNDHDTYRVVIDIPAGVTSVRTLTSDFGPATVTKDAAGLVTSVTWQKPLADLLPADTAYYKLAARMRLPNTPFATLYFVAHQTCRDTTGAEETVDWVGLPTDAPVPDGGPEREPAAALRIVPARVPGWNKYTLPAGVNIAAVDLPVYFVNSLIVWKGTAAYSPNPNISARIAATTGVTALTSVAAGDEIWVRF